MTRIGAVLLLWLASCGRAPDPALKEESPITLQLKLPASLAKNSGRHQRFLSRAMYLELYVEAKSGQQATHHFLPERWEKLSLPPLPFPSFPEDSLLLHVRVFDRKPDGSGRDYPVMTGKGQVQAKELKKEGVTTVPLNLSLHVSPSEYD